MVQQKKSKKSISRKGVGTLKKDQIRIWESSGKSDLPFGDYFKLVEVITPKTTSGQANRTIRINLHGKFSGQYWNDRTARHTKT